LKNGRFSLKSEFFYGIVRILSPHSYRYRRESFMYMQCIIMRMFDVRISVLFRSTRWVCEKIAQNVTQPIFLSK
jgi:hypothetical protein